LKTPHVAAAGATITPALRRLGEFKLRRVLGANFNEPMFALMNVDQLAAWENAGITVATIIQNQLGGDSSQDMLKKKPPKTFGGIDIELSIHATIARIDVVLPKHWGRGITKEVGYFEEGGQTVFPIYGPSGGLVAGYISYLDVVFNMFMDFCWSLLAEMQGSKFSLIDSNAAMPTRRKVVSIDGHRDRLSERTSFETMQQSGLTGKVNRKKSAEMTDSLPLAA
jgi:hypothetical protein